ncbi:MAG: MaoC family dehydratase [Stappiaceae bacterium]
MQFFDDIEIGTAEDLGSHVFKKDEIISFARQFDPQPFHVNEDLAHTGLFGGLCASGWHTTSVWMRKMVDFRNADIEQRRKDGRKFARLGPSPGFENLKWLNPVYVGDRISFRSKVIGKRTLSSRPEWGLLFLLNDGLNQHGDLVFSFEGRVFVERDPDRKITI